MWLLKLKDVLFPIRREELKKFIPCVLLYCFILYSFSALRILKDAALVTSVGAEAISFDKIYVVLPFTILFTSAYIYLSTKIDLHKLFYCINVFFISFFVFYLYVSMGKASDFYLDQAWIDQLVSSYPRFKWLIYMMQKWIITMFYLSGELYGILVIGFLYWQFMNQYTDAETAKRLYPSLGIFAQLGLIASGISINWLARTKNYKVNVLIALVVAATTVLVLYAWAISSMTEEVVKKEVPSSKKKISFTQAMKAVTQSRHVFLIFLMVFCYGATINLIEGPWKDYILKLYPTRAAYTQFMGSFVEKTGWVAIFIMILGQNILRYLGWFSGAMLTPIMGFLTGSAMFGLILMHYYHLTSVTPTLMLWL